MDFLKKLFGDRDAISATDGVDPAPPLVPVVAPVSSRRVTITAYGSDRFVAVDELGLMGQKSPSPDGRLFIVAGSILGSGDGGEPRDGAFAVVEGRMLRASGSAQRPQDGKVANSGDFIVNDWLHGSDLSGRFLGFHSDGRPAFSHLFAANLGCNGISADGRVAACQTYNAPGSPDSCIVAVFDLATGVMLGRFTPASTNARGVEFDTALGHIHLLTQDDDRETYRFDGEMVDRAGWRDRRIGCGDLQVIGDAVRELESAPAYGADPAMIETLLSGLAVAKADGQPWGQARACRLEGEMFEWLGEKEQALSAYDAALLLDPQVGVSRKAERLRKALDGGSPEKRRGRVGQQAERLGIRHETVLLESGGPKSWRWTAARPFGSVERAALDHYLDAGWSGAAGEGGLMLTLIKAASFEPLPARIADTFIEALYAQNVAFEEDRYSPDRLIATIASADLDRLRRNWRVISATAGASPAFYPMVHWEHVEGLFKVLGRDRLAAIATIFATAPYDLRAGWPDLTLWCEDEVRFVEVKAPSDQMHASQARLISTLLRPLDFEVTLAEIKRLPA